MVKIVQQYRGPTSQVSVYTGPDGQIVIDTNSRAVRVQDGATPGGFPTLMADNNLADLADKEAAKNNLELGTAADHDTSYFDLAGAAAAALVTAKSYADTGDAATLVTAKAYTDTGVTAAETFATAADVVVASTAATDATTKADAAKAAAIATSEAYTDTSIAALPNGSTTTIYYSPSGSPSGGSNGDLFLLGS